MAAPAGVREARARGISGGNGSARLQRRQAVHLDDQLPRRRDLRQGPRDLRRPRDSPPPSGSGARPGRPRSRPGGPGPGRGRAPAFPARRSTAPGRRASRCGRSRPPAPAAATGRRRRPPAPARPVRSGCRPSRQIRSRCRLRVAPRGSSAPRTETPASVRASRSRRRRCVQGSAGQAHGRSEAVGGGGSGGGGRRYEPRRGAGVPTSRSRTAEGSAPDDGGVDDTARPAATGVRTSGPGLRSNAAESYGGRCDGASGTASGLAGT